MPTVDPQTPDNQISLYERNGMSFLAMHSFYTISTKTMQIKWNPLDGCIKLVAFELDINIILF